VFLILLIVTLVGLFIYQLDYQHRYVVQSLETIENRKKVYLENISISENYTIIKRYEASDVQAKLYVLNGTHVGKNSSLGTKNEPIIVDSQTILNLTIPGVEEPLPPKNVIKNGDFSDDYKFWTYKPKANWPLFLNEIYKAAVYWRRINGEGRLSQVFTVEEDLILKEAKLEFKWKVGCLGMLRVTIDNNEVYQRWIYDDKWIYVNQSIDIKILNPGPHTLTFYAYTSERFCSLLIDDVKLILTYVQKYEKFSDVIYGVKTEVSFNLPSSNVYNFTCRLSVKVNRSLILEAYIFDEENNVWVLDNKFFAKRNEWFNLTFDTSKIMLYSESEYPFRVWFDYLYIEATELDPDGFTLTIENRGSYEVKVLAYWLKNETICVRTEIKKTLLPGDKLEIRNEDITLSRGSSYEIRVITRNNVFKYVFIP